MLVLLVALFRVRILNQVVLLLKVHLRKLAHCVDGLLVLRVEESATKLSLPTSLLLSTLVLLVFARSRRWPHCRVVLGAALGLNRDRLVRCVSSGLTLCRCGNNGLCRSILLLQIQLLRLIQAGGLRLLLF